MFPELDSHLSLLITTVLSSIDTLASSLPLASLRSVLGELATGFNGQGTNLQGLIDAQSALVKAGYATIGQTTTLIRDGKTVLATQVAEAGALASFGRNATLLAQRLDQSDSDLRRLLVAAPQAAAQVAGLLTDNTPSLGVLIANLLTTSDVTLTRGKALQELLSALPAGIAAGSTVINGRGARFGVALTFFSPLPCTAGYGGHVVAERPGAPPRPPPKTP